MDAEVVINQRAKDSGGKDRKSLGFLGTATALFFPPTAFNHSSFASPSTPCFVCPALQLQPLGAQIGSGIVDINCSLKSSYNLGAEHDSGYKDVGHRAGGHFALSVVGSQDECSDHPAAAKSGLFFDSFGCRREQPDDRGQPSHFPTGLSVYGAPSDEIFPCLHGPMATAAAAEGEAGR